ncbi:MAG TPA: hypothetical protein VIE89_16835 [Candidatus Binatia bacterium]|jgi:hypothetical protein
MAPKTVRLPVPANPNIEQVLQEFLAEQKIRLKPATFSNYESVIDLFRSHLNGYAYDGLSRAEAALFEKHYNAKGKEHREFCEIFGPDKIVDGFSGFLGYFMVRKVLAGEELKRAAGTVTKKLSKWLAEKGYTSRKVALEGFEEGAAAARNLPRAERAARLLYDAANRVTVDPNTLSDEDYQDFDHYTIVKIEPGELWMESFTGGGELIGPVRVPEKATALLRAGWNISCSLGRTRGQWRLLEMGNVYPN